MSEDQTSLEKEKRILSAFRKTLAQVVKDVTPSDNSLRSPLQPSTVEDVRMCFGLIAAREREIMGELKYTATERPQFIDEPTKSNVVSFVHKAPNSDSGESS